MATYRDIKGDLIETVASDPSNPIEGDIWYNTTTGTLKGLGFRAAAWSSGANLPSVRWNTSGTGTQTAGFVFGGATGPGAPTFLNSTFEYDGSSWTAGGTNPLTRINQFGAGTQTATIAGGGYYEPGGNTTSANTYNGTSWTGITATPFGTKGAGAAGTSTAALIYGSDVSPSDNQDSYSWNGTSWSEEGALNNTFQNGGSGGPTENTAFAAGSEYSPAPSNRFETYDGSSWTSGPNMVTPQYQNRGFGSSTSALSIGGFNRITTVQQYNGTSWATAPSLATGRKQFASTNFTASGVDNGFVAGGADGDATVEHFTDAGTENKTVTTST